jgi:endonuclease YncB( thermonuclease family)
MKKDLMKLIVNIRGEFDENTNLPPKKRNIKLTYWNIGRHLKKYINENFQLSDTWEEMMNPLAENLKINDSIFYRCIRFYETYPKSVAIEKNLNWTHIRTLLTVADKKVRQEYEKKILTEKINGQQFRALYKKDKELAKADAATKPPFIVEERGEPYVYRLFNDDGDLAVDLGFHSSVKSPDQTLTADSVFKVEKKDEIYKFSNTSRGVFPYYIYKAKVLEVVDGDTVWLRIDHGFNFKANKKIRLKGINAPEINTVEGQLTKDYVAKKLASCEYVAVKTYYRDNVGRFLAYIYYSPDETDIYKLCQNGKFLNQELLDKGLAGKL